MKLIKLFVVCVVASFVLASCAATKVTSQAKTPNSIDTDSAVSIQEAK